MTYRTLCLLWVATVGSTLSAETIQESEQPAAAATNSPSYTEFFEFDNSEDPDQDQKRRGYVVMKVRRPFGAGFRRVARGWLRPSPNHGLYPQLRVISTEESERCQVIRDNLQAVAVQFRWHEGNHWHQTHWIESPPGRVLTSARLLWTAGHGEYEIVDVSDAPLRSDLQRGQGIPIVTSHFNFDNRDDPDQDVKSHCYVEMQLEDGDNGERTIITRGWGHPSPNHGNYPNLRNVQPETFTDCPVYDDELRAVRVRFHWREGHERFSSEWVEAEGGQVIQYVFLSWTAGHGEYEIVDIQRSRVRDGERSLGDPPYTSHFNFDNRFDPDQDRKRRCLVEMLVRRPSGGVRRVFRGCGASSPIHGPYPYLCRVNPGALAVCQVNGENLQAVAMRFHWREGLHRYRSEWVEASPDHVIIYVFMVWTEGRGEYEIDYVAEESLN